MILGLITGTIKATNSWDYPLAILIVLISIILLNIYGFGSNKFKIVKTIVYFSIYFVFSKLLFLNFDNSFIMPEFALSISKWKTPFWATLEILFLPISLLLFLIILGIYGCNKAKTVLICGDHICINKAEAEKKADTPKEATA